MDTVERMGRALSAYGMPLMEVTSFKYLVRILSSPNDDWVVVEQNLRRARGKWGKMVNILGIYGTDRRTAGRFMLRWCKRCFSGIPDG